MLPPDHSTETVSSVAGTTPAFPRALLAMALFGAAAVTVAQTPAPGAAPAPATGQRSIADLFRTPVSTNALTGELPAPAALPWWQTNQPPSSISVGPLIGTEAFDSGLSADAVMPPSFIGNPVYDVPPILRWGPVTAHPHLAYGLTYGDGLLASRGEREDTLVQTVSPGLRLDVGKHWVVDYTPRLVFYESEAFRDTVNHDVQLDGFGQKGDWSLNLSNAFVKNDSSLVETGRQTDQTLNTTHIGANYPLAPQWQLDLGVSQNLRWTGEFNNTYSWSTLDSIRYRIREKSDIGLSLGLGYDMVEPGTDMWNQRVMGSFRGQVGSKFNYSLSGGIELRQFVDTDAGTEISPIFDANLGYQLTSTTILTAHFTEQVSPSYFNDEFTTSTVVEGTLNQRFLGKFNAMLTGGYRWADYKSTENPGLLVRQSDYEFVRVGLGARFLRRGSASVYYMLSKNISSVDALSFSSHQFGMQLTYGF